MMWIFMKIVLINYEALSFSIPKVCSELIAVFEFDINQVSLVSEKFSKKETTALLWKNDKSFG